MAVYIIKRKNFSNLSENDIKKIIPNSFRGKSLKVKGAEKLEKSDIELIKETLDTIANDFLSEREQDRKNNIAPFADLTSFELKNISKKFYVSEINVNVDKNRKIVSIYIDIDDKQYKGCFWEYDIDIRDGEIFYIDKFADRL